MLILARIIRSYYAVFLQSATFNLVPNLESSTPPGTRLRVASIGSFASQ